VQGATDSEEDKKNKKNQLLFAESTNTSALPNM